MLQPGTDAPDFSVNDHNGNTINLKDYRGKKVVIWFYPKADDFEMILKVLRTKTSRYLG